MPGAKKRREAPNGADVGRGSRKAPRQSLQDLVPVAPPAAPPKTKHHSYFEFVENTDKKKKLEFKIVTQTEPPPGFEFVPTGNPELTTACKEISREKDAMILIVSDSRYVDSDNITHQVHRVGHHVRQSIVEEARQSLAHLPNFTVNNYDGVPEPIPASQEDYNSQVDAAIRDLFPRIPHTDRLQIIRHAFQKVRVPIGPPLAQEADLKKIQNGSRKKEPPVGLCSKFTLARRVQLATLAHIRHTLTRYDELLHETDWASARKIVERPCLDIIVKWRGDEETGRDQLEEILREVVVISDSEEESDEEDTSDTSMDEATSDLPPRSFPAQDQTLNSRPAHRDENRISIQLREARAAERKNQRGFQRYRAFEAARQRNEASISSFQPDRRLVPPSVIISRPVNDPFGTASRDLPQEPRPPLPRESGALNNSNSASPVPMLPERSQSRRERPYSVSALNPPTPPTPPAHSDPSRFQDLLVPSVEPMSPDASSSVFVRMLPPRIIPRDLPLSRPRSEVFANRPRSPVGFSRDDVRRDERLFVEPVQPSHSYNKPASVRHRVADYQPPADSMSRLHIGGRPSERAPARILVETGRPGDRFNPIVMEDRGGFYEKVPVPLEQQQLAERPRSLQGIPAHRVVSSEEGSRILRESRGSDVEVFPIMRPRGTLEALHDSFPRDSNGPTHVNPVNSSLACRGYVGPAGVERSQERPKAPHRDSSANPSFWEIRRDGVGTHFTPVGEQGHPSDRERDHRRHTVRNPIVID